MKRALAARFIIFHSSGPLFSRPSRGDAATYSSDSSSQRGSLQTPDQKEAVKFLNSSHLEMLRGLLSDRALGDLCKCAHGVCEDKARQLQWGVIFQAHISPASNRIKNEAAEAERLSNTIIQNAVYTIFANKQNTQVAYISLLNYGGLLPTKNRGWMQISVNRLTINVQLCLQAHNC